MLLKHGKVTSRSCTELGTNVRILRFQSFQGLRVAGNCQELPSSMTRFFQLKARPPDHEHPEGPAHSPDMSLKEAKGRNIALASSQPVLRSHSFGGMSAGSQTGSSTQVLGQSMKRSSRPHAHNRYHQSPRTSHSFHGLRKSPKIPKKPRPTRALLMFHSIKNGIREHIHVTQDDIRQLQACDSATSTAQGKVHETDKQIKSAERYLKKLEFHLAKIDELHECYLIHQKLLEGARAMARAYAINPGNRKDSLTNVKYGYEECSQTLCAIEAQLENMCGTFHCKLKGMAGFARLCPGDVFEVSIRHGPQKWKSKGRIEKNNTQRWDVPEFTFKSLVGEILIIKAQEVRSFKSVLLGQKNCEVKDLFSANPQLMTISINFNGSLKLSIVITWNPLESIDESVTYFQPPARPQAPRRRPVSVLALNGHLSGSYSDLQGPERRYSSPLHVHPQHSMVARDDSFTYSGSSFSLLGSSPQFHQFHSAHASPAMGMRSAGDQKIPGSEVHLPFWRPLSQGSFPPQNVASSLSLQQAGLASSSSSSTSQQLPGVLMQNYTLWREEAGSVEEALFSLSTSLEDFRGQYNELQTLEEVVIALEAFVRKQSRGSRCSSRSSSISVSIESALEAFDFLNTEESPDEMDPSPVTSRKTSLEHLLSSPESTAKTGDSGIESLAQRLSEDTQLGSSLGSSPIPPSTGNEQVDTALLFHLAYCDWLLESLGNYGPLKCREFYALEKLQRQGFILQRLLEIAKAGADINLHGVLTELTEDKAIREFWVTSVEHSLLSVHPERLLIGMEQKFGSRITDRFQVLPKRVFRCILAKILDIADYVPEKIKSSAVVTLHQLVSYFKAEGGLQKIEQMAEELQLCDQLMSGNTDRAIKAILTLRDELPAPTPLKVIGMLLHSPVREIQQSAAAYLKVISRNKVTRDKAMVVLVEGLEDHLPDVRGGACTALSVLEALESLDQLVYICQSDSSSTVRRRAKEALFSLGPEGRTAFEQAQLGAHGFQGMQIKK
ncbi:rho family-interacting cell polarization regulator 2-like isoform X3 [Pomacea canaliculata]|uniref:rho family-interacting cell polarization regulator 2-like isoform X3 n=1 Tax=Pomacea canaliculata TaxID=400727 RepID=UPI000D7278E3|nr:rho family-interacting cell polarization regulator 2-like isoform X3 [Pomacea canaliculata]